MVHPKPRMAQLFNTGGFPRVALRSLRLPPPKPRTWRAGVWGSTKGSNSSKPHQDLRIFRSIGRPLLGVGRGWGVWSWGGGVGNWELGRGGLGGGGGGWGWRSPMAFQQVQLKNITLLQNSGHFQARGNEMLLSLLLFIYVYFILFLGGAPSPRILPHTGWTSSGQLWASKMNWVELFGNSPVVGHIQVEACLRWCICLQKDSASRLHERAYPPLSSTPTYRLLPC